MKEKLRTVVRNDFKFRVFLNRFGGLVVRQPHPRRRNVTTSIVRFKKSHIRKHLTQNGEPQRYSWGTQRKKTTAFRSERHGCLPLFSYSSPSPSPISPLVSALLAKWLRRRPRERQASASTFTCAGDFSV